MNKTRIHIGDGSSKDRSARDFPKRISERFRTGVSLHSHTLHSKESLNFIYHASRHSALLRWVVRQGAARYQKLRGATLDLNRGWWTPPLAPLDAFEVEAGQIAHLGLSPIVSLTDHDDIEAPMSLQAVTASRAIPVSVEWTVPYGDTFFHLGVHNIPAANARATMTRLKCFTASPDAGELTSILADLDRDPTTLIVFNHPLWDEKGIGTDIHRKTAVDLLSTRGRYLHALEINGLRPWRENRDVVEFASAWGKPLISGGDRHAVEPNANINLTNATCFADFAHEVRHHGWSDLLLMPHYHQPHANRILHNMLDVFRTYENHRNGWTEWGDRVFYTMPDGTVLSLSEIWGEKPPSAVAMFAGIMRFAGRPTIRLALRSLGSEVPVSAE